MSIKGLKEALAKKQAQQRTDDAKDSADIKITPTAPVRIGSNKPQKRATGRGR